MTTLIPVAEARRLVLAAITPLAPRRVAIGNALGYVTAETVQATEPMPRFANAAMDGYAVRPLMWLPPRFACE